MKESFALKLLDRFSGLFYSFGVNYPAMRRIIRLKLIMDGRRTTTVMSGSNRRSKAGNSSYKTSLIIYLFMGVFIALFMIIQSPLYIKMNMTFGIILFMIMTTMISDFSAVLLDVRDKSILLTRPVDTKTLNAAKVVHIVIYLSGITAAIAGIPLVAGTVLYGPVFFLLFFIALILICGFTILFTAILYFVILHFFSGEKLKDIINYFQIALSVFMVLAYQMIGRLYSIVDINITAKPALWNLALPSAWFAAPFSVLIEHNYSMIYILLSVIAVVVPFAAMFIYIKAAAPAFEKSLLKLTNGEGTRHKLKKGSLQRTASRLLCRSREESAFFNFTTLMFKNERKLKLKMYPSLALAYVFPIIFILSFLGKTSSFADAYSLAAHGHYYLYLYASVAMFSPLCMMMSMSENYKGAWIYQVLPMEHPAPILRGALKSFMFRFLTPFFILWGIILTAVYGVPVIPQVFLILINTLIILTLVFMVSKKELPFYKDFDVTQGGKNVGIVFLLFAVCGLFAGIQYLVTRFFSPGRFICIAAGILIFMILWFSAFRISWKDLKEA